jgi:hypothetical protein
LGPPRDDAFRPGPHLRRGQTGGDSLVAGRAGIRRDIAARIRDLLSRRDVLTQELAAINKNRERGVPEPPPLSDREKAHRAWKIALLDDVVPLLELAPPISHEEELFRERDGIDAALTELQRRLTVAEAREAREFAYQHADDWKTLCREHLLSAIKLQALERRAETMIERMGPGGIRMPMSEFVGRELQILYPGAHLEAATRAAIAEGIISKKEIS